MTNLIITPVEHDIHPKEGGEFTLNLRVTGANPKYKTVRIDSSVKNTLEEYGINYLLRTNAEDAIIKLSGVPVKSGSIIIGIYVIGKDDEPAQGTYVLNIAPKTNAGTINIAPEIPVGRKGCIYNFDIKSNGVDYKDIEFKLTPASQEAIRACGLSLSPVGILNGTISKDISGISAGIEILATRSKTPVNVNPSNYPLRILDEVTLELDSNYISTNTIEVNDQKKSGPVKFASNDASADLNFKVKLLDPHSKSAVATNRFTFEKIGMEANYILKDDYNSKEKELYTSGKSYKLLITGTDSKNSALGEKYNNTYTWTYDLKVIPKQNMSLSIDDLALSHVTKNNAHHVYELETGANISIPLKVTGGLKPYLNNIKTNSLYSGLDVKVESEVLKIFGTIDNSDDQYFTKRKKKTITLNIGDRDTAVSVVTPAFIVKLPPVAKNVSEEEVPELVQGAQQTIDVDSFNEVSSIDYPDYNTLYPSHVILTENPTLQGATWGTQINGDGTVYKGSMGGKEVISITTYTAANRGVSIRTAKDVPEANVRLKFKLKNLISESRERLANIPVKAPSPLASQTLSSVINHGDTAKIELETNSHGAPFDAVAISGDSLRMIKEVMDGTSSVDNTQGKFILNITPGEKFIGGVEYITFYLIKGKLAAKGKVKISMKQK